MNFKLKTPHSKNESLILFYANLKNGERFVYSTGERIHPQYWDKRNQYPKRQKETIKANRIILRLNCIIIDLILSLLIGQYPTHLRLHHY